MLEDEEPNVKTVIGKRANQTAQRAVNAMPTEPCKLMVIEADAARRSSGKPLYQQPGAKIRRHAICAKPRSANRVPEQEEAAVRWIVIFLFAALLGLTILGLVNGFALAEASILFLVI